MLARVYSFVQTYIPMSILIRPIWQEKYQWQQ